MKTRTSMLVGGWNRRLAMAAVAACLGCRATEGGDQAPTLDAEQHKRDEYLVADLVLRPRAMHELMTRRFSMRFEFAVVHRHYVDPAASRFQSDPLLVRLFQGENREDGRDAIERLRDFLREVPSSTARDEHLGKTTLFAAAAPLCRLVVRRDDQMRNEWRLVADNGQTFHGVLAP